MNLNYRLTHYSDDEATELNLVDAVLNIASRASAVLSMIQVQYQTGNKMNDQTNFEALDSVRMDIADIETVIKHFYDQRKKQI